MSALKPTSCQRCIQCSEEKLSLYKYSHSSSSQNCKIWKTNFSGHAAPTLTLECLSIFCSNMRVLSFKKYLTNALIDIFVSLNIKHKAFLLHEPCNQLPMLFHILIVWKETFFLDTRHVTSLVTPVFTQPVHAKMATVKKISECAGRGKSVPMKSAKEIGSLPRSKFHSSVIFKSSKDSHFRSERIRLKHATPLHQFS